jgi:hypothetical protein
MTATILKYNIQQITDLSFSGFKFELPEDTVSIINYLCSQVGSSPLKSNIYQKQESSRPIDNNNYKLNNKKRRGNKTMEVNSEDWESLRTFQTTKIEQKTGVDSDILEIRMLINKITDKTFLDIRQKLIDRINKICVEYESEEIFVKTANMIYDIASTNKYYSKIYADLFAELLNIFTWIRPIFDENYNNIMEQYKNIKYCDPDKDYDGFCDMNKVNEKRRAVTTFFMNLALNGCIKKEFMVNILKDLLVIVTSMVTENDHKNEVDELTENIAIIFNKEMIEEVEDDSNNVEDYYVSDKSILDTVNILATSKSKDYPGLSNKTIFKYMDLIDM